MTNNNNYPFKFLITIINYIKNSMIIDNYSMIIILISVKFTLKIISTLFVYTILLQILTI